MTYVMSGISTVESRLTHDKPKTVCMSSDCVPVIDKPPVFGAKELKKVRRSHF